MATFSNGRFQAAELTFQVTGTEFVVNCGATDRVLICGQRTAQTLVQTLDAGNREALRNQLQAALTALGPG